MSERVTIVIPAYDESRTIGAVIRSLKARGYARIVVVDDASGDDTGELARQEGALVVRHVVNRGVGGALGTGLQAALRLRAAVIVTFDADGQHDPGDIPRLVEPIERGEVDAVIGSRLLDPRGMPWSRRVANRLANLATYVLFGARTTDSQSGLRAFSRQAAERIRIRTSGMEVSSEIIAEIARNRLEWREVAVRAIYTDYSLSKGQSFRAGLRTLAKLVRARVRR